MIFLFSVWVVLLLTAAVILVVSWQRGFRPNFTLTFSRMLAMGMGGLLVAAFLGLATARSNPGLQIAELEGYTRLTGQPRQVFQVALAQHSAFSQYSPAIISPAAGNFGSNACGLIAAAQAVVLSQNPALDGTPQGFNAVFNLMSQVRAEAVLPDGRLTYQAETGIQPTPLVQALHDSPLGSQYDITARNDWSLSRLVQALQQGRMVIVDLRIRQQTEAPATTPDTFAHFARVLGVDLDRQEIYIENTLDQREGKSYWALSLEDFMEAWSYPETQATIRPSQKDPTIREENVTNWAMVLSKTRP